MARTPLMDYLLRTYRTVRWAKQNNIPLDEARELERDLLTRRRLLQYGAGLSAVGLLGCGTQGGQPNDGGMQMDAGHNPDAGMPMPVETRVAIVGGGLAGLHCAYRLKKRGLSASVYEGSKRVGGRLFTDRMTFGSGVTAELGGELIDTRHQVVRALAQELGVALADHSTDNAQLSKITAYFGGKTLTDMEILNGFAPIAAKMDQSLNALTGWPSYHDAAGGAALDQMSILQWFNQNNIDAADPVRRLIEVAYLGEYGLELDVSNSLNLLGLISTETSEFSIFGNSDERFYVKGGSDALTTALAMQLDAAQMHLEHRLVALKLLSDGRFELTFQQGASTPVVKAEHVVLALPFTMLRQVQLDENLNLPMVKKKAINELSYGTNGKLMVGFSDRVWRTQHNAIGTTYSEFPYQESWETGRVEPRTYGVMTQYVGGTTGANFHQQTLEERAAAFLNDFDKVYPGAKAAHDGKVSRFAWANHEFTKGSYAAYSVGQYTTISGAERERVGNLHFCGEHTSIESQGYIEGAAATGADAAADVAMALALP